MRNRHRSAVATLAAAAMLTGLAALAPPAGATTAPLPANSNPINCRDAGTAKVCGKQGHSSLHAEPTIRMPQGQLFSNAWLPGYGRGHLPPILALD